MHLCRSSSNVPLSHACHRFWKCYKPSRFKSLLTRCTIPCACQAKRHLNVQKPLVLLTFWLRNVLRATCTFSTSQLPKVVRAWCVLHILTSKRASCHNHNGVHFFDISTSKSGQSMVCFVHFDFEMCFAPRRRALFRHLNFQKWSEPGVCLYIFFFEMCFAATTACNFSSLIWPAGSAPAALASLPFDPPHQSLEKHGVSRLFYLFAHLDLLSSETFSFWSSFFFSSLTLPISAFHLSILSEVWLLNFLRQGHWAGRVLFIGTTQTVKNLKCPTPAPLAERSYLATTRQARGNHSVSVSESTSVHAALGAKKMRVKEMELRSWRVPMVFCTGSWDS